MGLTKIEMVGHHLSSRFSPLVMDWLERQNNKAPKALILQKGSSCRLRFTCNLGGKADRLY